MTPPPQPAAARHAVGIDLGTSHTVVAHVPLDGGVADIALLPLAQRISAAEVQEQPLLPSTRYQAAPGELGDAWRQPWPAQDATEQTPAVIGRWARDLGAAVPGRLVASAKSWLSHAGVDRTAPILPWGAGQDVAKVSPLQASSSYLAHVRAAWDATHPDAPLADLGTGPGLPGIPLAIARPGCTVTLVESNGKKARFLREAVRTLKLPNARVAESRAENLDEPGAYTVITARALATLDRIIEVGGHLLAPEGRLLAMKAETVAEEAARLPAGWRLDAVHPLAVPGLVATRQLAVVARAR